MISQVGLEILTQSNFDLRLRSTPIENVQDFAERLSEKGDFCIAGPVIDVEDVDVLLNRAVGIKIRHNISKWDTCENFELRLYRSTKSKRYKRIKAELTEDHIIVCPNNPFDQPSTNQRGQGAPNQPDNAEQAQGRTSGIDDEGYGKGAASPSSNVARIVPTVEESALSNLEIHFHRKKHETCSEDQPHSITIHIAIEKRRSSLEASMQKVGMEEAAEVVEVASIDRRQVYTPVLGTYPKRATNPCQIWDGGRLTPFSYLHLNRTSSGFMKLQKFPPPDMRMACEGDYKYIRLNQQTNHQSDDPLCSDIGWRIEPKACQSFHNQRNRGSDSEAGIDLGTQSTNSRISREEEEPRSAGRRRKRQERLLAESPSSSNDESYTDNCAYEEGTSSVFFNSSQEQAQLPSGQTQEEAEVPVQKQNRKRKHLNEKPPDKRQCPYCDQTLSRKQSWDKHKDRKHSTLGYVDFKKLQPVQTFQESVFTEEATERASAMQSTNLHSCNDVEESSSSSQQDVNMGVSTQERLQLGISTSSDLEVQQNSIPLVDDEQNFTISDLNFSNIHAPQYLDIMNT